MHLIPAYGRDYKSKVKALKDFYDGKDFFTCAFGLPQLINLEDVKKRGISQVSIRYAKKQK